MISRRGLLAGLAAPPARPNIVLLVADDLRHDALGCYGNRVARTPHLDAMSRGGVTFLSASCAHPLCSPSRAEVMTGCTGFRSGAHSTGRIRPDVPRWARTLRDAGYRTWYSGKWHNNGRPSDHGYERTEGLYTGAGGKWAQPRQDWKGREITGYRGWIFESSDGAPLPELGVGLTPEISRHVADAAIRVIRNRAAAPFFLHVNFTAPHDPLMMPPGYERMYDPVKIPLPVNFMEEHPFDHGNLRGRDELLWTWPRTAGAVRDELAHYYAVLTHLDAQIGRVLASLDETGQSANTLLIFTADNGLAIGSHGLRGKQNMYEHSIGVPLLVRGPGIAAGLRTPDRRNATCAIFSRLLVNWRASPSRRGCSRRASSRCSLAA
jgi:arylsulfatase A-like enzyme